MIRILLTSGQIVDVPDATAAEVQGREVVCSDRHGVVVARFPSESVTIYGSHLPLEAELQAFEDSTTTSEPA